MKRSDVFKDVSLVLMPLAFGLVIGTWWPAAAYVGTFITALAAWDCWCWYHKNGTFG